MIERKTIDQIQKVSIPTRIVCDKCGKDARMVGGIGVRTEYPFSGALVEARIYEKGGNLAGLRLFSAQLCEDCAKKLEKWIGGGETTFPYSK